MHVALDQGLIRTSKFRLSPTQEFRLSPRGLPDSEISGLRHSPLRFRAIFQMAFERKLIEGVSVGKGEAMSVCGGRGCG